MPLTERTAQGDQYVLPGAERRTEPGLPYAAEPDGQLALVPGGRARRVTEAILGHGGEADRARGAFMALPRGDREKLVRFVLGL
ncbi:hypothetical protein GAY28_08405 [Azospirillum brasilense]|nr:hypothetical protein [Azospirillum brasilense]